MGLCLHGCFDDRLAVLFHASDNDRGECLKTGKQALEIFMSNPLLRSVSIDERLRFLRDGVVCLRKIISPEWIQLAQDGIEQQRRAPSPYATVVDADPLYLLIDQMPSVQNGMLQRVVFESGAGEIAKQLTVTRRLRWIYDQLFYKGRGPAAETPWHQDTSYGLADSHRIVRVWMPVDHMPRETAIEVVRGSHLWKTHYGLSGSKIEVLDDEFELPDIEANRSAFDIVGYEVDPGDVVVFNYRALHHAGPGVNFNEKRRAFAILYADDELRLKHRPSLMPGPLDTAGLAWRDGQKTGDFPEVFRAV
jgi:hypothetical protein